MSRYVDPRAPTEPSSTDLDAVKIDPKLVRLRQLRDHLSKEVRHESGTLKQAEMKGTKLYRMYKNAEDALRCTKAKLRKSAQEEACQRFFDTIDTLEINKQLDPSFLDLEDCAWEPKQIEHALEERALAAELLCKNIAEHPATVQLEHRTMTIIALIALCRRREAPQRCKKDGAWGVIDGMRAAAPFPTECRKTQCLFALEISSNRKKSGSIVTLLSTRREIMSNVICKPTSQTSQSHAGISHVKDGGVLLVDREHFINHAATEHGYDVFRKTR